ncbi:TAXI family TRAP transporter solute-binding subunit [Neosynechococcus sphagnicola]|uniref:TAXI family TRAP transporter solute-binding subunit n=1 Tax=Neosynechococcus sphagnicola TaxID=1501145 RepID=UPI0019552D94|nr:TAXI family TRAP transporter solute-binding subunit [Neosynechococcus sphagnicola]
MKKSVPLLALSLLTTLIILSGNVFTATTVVAQQTLSILTGAKTGLYYQAAIELNQVLKPDGFTLKIQESPGSFNNLKELGSGNGDLAFAQQDAFRLLKGVTDQNLAQLAENVDVFAPVNHEVIHIVVNQASGIKSLADLHGKVVAVGPEDSGTYVSAILLYQLSNLDVTRESLLLMSIQDALAKVQTGEIDAAFYTAGVGAPLVERDPSNRRLNVKTPTS